MKSSFTHARSFLLGLVCTTFVCLSPAIHAQDGDALPNGCPISELLMTEFVVTTDGLVAFELYNGTGVAHDLGDYYVRFATANEAVVEEFQLKNLSGDLTIEDGEALVFVVNDAPANLIGKADFTLPYTTAELNSIPINRVNLKTLKEEWIEQHGNINNATFIEMFAGKTLVRKDFEIFPIRWPPFARGVNFNFFFNMTDGADESNLGVHKTICREIETTPEEPEPGACEDNEKPTVTANLELINSDRPKYNKYAVRCEITDDCNENPNTIGFIKFPDLGDIEVQLQTANKPARVRIFSANNGEMVVKVRSKDPATTWANIESTGGFEIPTNTSLYTRSPRADANTRRDMWRYDKAEETIRLIMAETITLVCKILDGSNAGFTDEVTVETLPGNPRPPKTLSFDENSIEELEELAQYKQYTETQDESVLTRDAIFPNPAKEHVYVPLEAYVGKPVRINIVDQLGRTLYDRNFLELDMELLGIDISSRKFAKGVYYLQIRHEGEIDTQRLIIEK